MMMEWSFDVMVLWLYE